MKKSVVLLVVLLCTLPTALAFRIQSVPESFDIRVPVGDCAFEPLTMLVSDGTQLDFQFALSSELQEYVHLSRIDDTHFHVYFHPTQDIVGQEINGLLYVTGSAPNHITSLSGVSFPVEITLRAQESQDGYERACPVLGEEVKAVPLSMDAVSLLMLVLVSLGVVNVSARLKIRGGKRD